MQSGRETLASIERAARLVHSQVEEIDRQIKQQSDTLVELQRQQADRFKRIARIRLDNVVSGELAAGLDAAGRRTAELLKQRVEELASLEEQIKATRAKLERLEAERGRLSDRVAQATEALDKAEASTQRRLDQTPAYQAQLEKAREADRTAKHAEEKTQQAEQAHQQKGIPYDNDPLFSYLWRRGYGTSEYSAGPLVRFLDDWVAKLCNYHDARPNYAMLMEIPKRLREHAGRVRAAADAEFAAVTEMEERAAKEDGVPPLAVALQQAQSDVDKVDAEIEQVGQQLRELELKRASFSSGEDVHFKQAIDTLSSAFERENLQTLYAYARATATAEDDVLVQEIQETSAEVQAIQTSLADSKQMRERHLDRLQQLEEVTRRFKQQRYDSPHSEFGNAALLAMLLNQFLQGTASSRELWRAIERAQRYRRIESNPDFGSGGFGGRQGTWHFPFPRGGGVGGGGLGGGLGRGGGGFRTGGGF